MEWKGFLFSFSGRISRKPFWLFHLVVVVLYVFLKRVVAGKVDFDLNDRFSFIYMLIFLWPMTAVQVKRWHDRNKSAWWLLINFVPLVGGIWVLVETGILEGTRGENRYGKDPLDGAERKFDIHRKFSEKEALWVAGILGLFGFGLFLWAVAQEVTR